MAELQVGGQAVGCRRDAAVSAGTQLRTSQGIHVTPSAAGGGSPLGVLGTVPWSDSESWDAAGVAQGLPSTAAALGVCGHPAPVPSSQGLRSSLWNLLYSGKSSPGLGVRALLGSLLGHWTAAPELLLAWNTCLQTWHCSSRARTSGRCWASPESTVSDNGEPQAHWVQGQHRTGWSETALGSPQQGRDISHRLRHSRDTDCSQDRQVRNNQSPFTPNL